MKRSNKGFTLVEIMIVVAIIGIIIAIAVPGFLRAREASRARACQAQLLKIEGAIEQWAMETNQQADDIAAGWTPELLEGATAGSGYFRVFPTCPAGGTYDNGADMTDVVTCDADNVIGEARYDHSLEAARGEAVD